jgi:hypothetical protein
MNKSKSKKKNGLQAYTKKMKATVNELRWLDQHENQSLSSYVAAKWGPRLTVSRLLQKPKQAVASAKWLPMKQGTPHSRIHIHGGVIEQTRLAEQSADDDSSIDEFLEDQTHQCEMKENIMKSDTSHHLDHSAMITPLMQSQFGEMEFVIPYKQHSSDIRIQFAKPYSDDQYALVVTNQQPDFYATVKAKWKDSAMIHVRRIKPSSLSVGKIDWISCGHSMA